MRRDARDGLLAYRGIEPPRVDALVSTRVGGVSEPPYASLNLGLHVGDDPDAVTANRERFFAAYGLPLERSVWCRQVHGNDVHVVAEGGSGAYSLDAVEADALVTDRVGIPLCVLMADCVPVLLYDPVRHVAGLAHAGWAGTVAHVAAATVRALADRYGTDPADLRALIGPSISPDRYEVGDDVISRAREAYGDAPVLRELGGGKALFDLWEANAVDLERAGVPRAQIEISGIASSDRLDEFFSHRFEPPATGRFAAVVMLRD
jgi:YfiH family protein